MNLAGQPRVRLTTWPTPLEECPRLSAALGGPHLWVKRDDLPGLGLGGNKVRKLEYLLGDAIRRGADTVITTGGPQSNHARLTAAACRHVGLDVVLVLGGEDPAVRASGQSYPQANLLLDNLFGAEIVRIEDDSDAAANQAMDDVATRLARQGRHPYIIPMGGSNDVGTLGYVGCALELAGQCSDEGVQFDHIFVTAGSGGTQAGLHLGAALYLPGTVVHGVAISRAADAEAAKVEGIVAATAALLGLDPNPAQPPVVVGGYVGEGYAIPTAAGWEAMLVAARTEGLVLDPVYTGKAMAGLIGTIREGALPSTANVLFVHTGGAPGFLAQAASFDRYLRETRAEPEARGETRDQ